MRNRRDSDVDPLYIFEKQSLTAGFWRIKPPSLSTRLAVSEMRRSQVKLMNQQCPEPKLNTSAHCSTQNDKSSLRGSVNSALTTRNSNIRLRSVSVNSGPRGLFLMAPFCENYAMPCSNAFCVSLGKTLKLSLIPTSAPLQ